MNKGRIIAIISSLVGIVLLAIVFLAISVGSEASKMDKMLKDDVTRHAPVAEVQSQLAAAGYKVEGQLPKLKATGPTHTVIVYSTSLWVELTFNEDGTMSGFHLDRQG